MHQNDSLESQLCISDCSAALQQEVPELKRFMSLSLLCNDAVV